MKQWFILAAFCASDFASPVLAQPVLPWLEADLNGQCGYSHVYHDAGVTAVLVQQNAEMPAKVLIFGIKNNNWSVASGDPIKQPATIQSGSFSMSGPALPGAHMIGVALTEETLTQFAQSDPKIVEVRLGSQLLTRLDFTGFMAGWDAFARCFAKGSAWRSYRDERSRHENPDIPNDPFAAKPPAPEN